MAYERVNWENLPSTNTPVNATNLNKIENELENLDNLTTYSTTTATINSNYFSQVDVNIVQKIGKIVFFNFRGLVSNNIPSNTGNIITLPYNSKIGTSEVGVAFTGGEYNYNSSPIWFYFMGHDIRMSNINAGNWVHIQHIYITN